MIRVLNQLESEQRQATPEERQVISRFCGFGPVALSLFPDPITGQYKDPSWRALGEELRSLLSQDDYDSAKRTTFNAFYTSPTVVRAVHEALDHIGVSGDAIVLEPGCGIGNFMGPAAGARRFLGVELDRTSGRIARALHPRHQVRIENFRDTKLPGEAVDAVVGNVPFANLKLSHNGQRFSLHDFFFAKSIDVLKPGGVLALVTSHYTMDKQNAAIREYLADRADFLGAIRLPSNAFKREGTSVVADIVFLRKRAPGKPAHHVDPDWLGVLPLNIGGADVSINRYFLNHPDMVLGNWSRNDTLYGDGYSVVGNGDLAEQLRSAIQRLPRCEAASVAKPTEHRPVFRPPPPVRQVGEGSFVIRDDQSICQMETGEEVPVTHAGKSLKANGTMMGRRLAGLIGVRDAARRVLQSQNEGWPETDRAGARKTLNRAYDHFVWAYGPINKTTFGETAEGHVIRRMPNLVKFREDPDAMLVMSLEDYDELTGSASKAAIMHKDVVGKQTPVTSVRSAEDGLLVCLDQKGRIDLSHIAKLYGKPEPEIIAELGDLIYFNPRTTDWETADVYLSGNVRAKLAEALDAGPEYARNAEALRAVQPPDVLPGEIDANLGAPWIPEEDVQTFANRLFGADSSSVKVSHLKKDAVWSVEADGLAENSVAATSDFGTPRAGGVGLLELALNMKAPVIYDSVHAGDREERVVNQQETLAAREKQKRIKETFRTWLFEEPARAERLVRLYNDTYNNLRPRLFDGAHLEFPGMNTAVTLRPHQKDAIWRGMSSGNTLLAHAVGAGKTFIMAATGMKMKEAGLIQKPLYVVPNHMLEQFAREFMQLYPNARLLVASKEDLARDRRKQLTAKIATGAWDGVIVTHSSFERIGMSRGYQEKFLRQQIAEYDQLLRDRASNDGSRGRRNLIKVIEKQKAQREEKLKDLLAEEKKDDGLVFDELGVDHVFIDEAHYFKNLETPTKMERVAGIQTGGSERAFDLYMKARYLDERHAGHGVTFATGTPISNTMVELYTLQRFLDPKGLADRGIEHFDAWAATFGEVVDTMEIAPDGASLRPRSRFARFTNLPELQQMFRAFADVRTADMLDLPRPCLEGGKAIVVPCPMSEEQQEIQQSLVGRYERLRSQKIDPRTDNALAITTDGRKLALDARMLVAKARDHPGSKVNALVGRVTDIWKRTESSRGTQMIFCDLGVHATPWGYSVYDEIIDKLAARGVPRSQIAAIGDADTDAKKQALFESVRKGVVRVLIGSTQKMGTGSNVQKRLVALHHLDAPWKPAEVEQREGRILRQGNENPEVAIYRYVTEGSFDAYMWQALETKARFIAQIMTGDTAVRRAEDIGGQELSYAEVKAIASGNPAVLTLAQADAELQRLAALRKHHADEQFLARRHLRELPAEIERLASRLKALETDRKTLGDHADSPLSLDGRSIPRSDLIAILGARLERLPKEPRQLTRIKLGNYRGLDFGVVIHPSLAPEAYLEGATTCRATFSRENPGPRAFLNALERLVAGYEERIERTSQDLTLAEGQLRDYQARLGTPFVRDEFCRELAGLRDRLKLALSQPPSMESDAQPGESIAGLAERIQTLLQANVVEAAPRRGGAPPISTAEQAVTTRIRARRESFHPAPSSDVPAQPINHPDPAFPIAPDDGSDPAPTQSVTSAPPDSPDGSIERPKERLGGFQEKIKKERRPMLRQQSLF